MPNPADGCPHCIFGTPVHLNMGIWNCPTCHTSFHEQGLAGIHYWSYNGEFHDRPDIDEECTLTVEGRLGVPRIPPQ